MSCRHGITKGFGLVPFRHEHSTFTRCVCARQTHDLSFHHMTCMASVCMASAQVYACVTTLFTTPHAWHGRCARDYSRRHPLTHGPLRWPALRSDTARGLLARASAGAPCLVPGTPEGYSSYTSGASVQLQRQRPVADGCAASSVARKLCRPAMTCKLGTPKTDVHEWTIPEMMQCTSC